MTPEEAGAVIHALGDAFRTGDVDAATGQFLTEGEVMYSGSEHGEVAVGLTDLQSLFTDVFARDERYSWRCNAVHVVACPAGFAVLADATLLVTPYPSSVDDATVAFPYRITGLLENESGNWRWRSCHGSEPAAPASA
jgi:hypothetical protein